MAILDQEAKECRPIEMRLKKQQSYGVLSGLIAGKK